MSKSKKEHLITSIDGLIEMALRNEREMLRQGAENCKSEGSRSFAQGYAAGSQAIRAQLEKLRDAGLCEVL